MSQEYPKSRIFSAGDSVVLISGSRKMTVAGYLGFTDKVVCRWMENENEQASDVFSESLLKYFEKEINAGELN